MTLKIKRRRQGKDRGMWFVLYKPIKSREWKAVCGPCKSERGAEQRLLSYEQKEDKDFCDRVGAQLMAKSWGEIKL